MWKMSFTCFLTRVHHCPENNAIRKCTDKRWCRQTNVVSLSLFDPVAYFIYQFFRWATDQTAARLCVSISNRSHSYTTAVPHSGKRPTPRTILSIICLFESSTCFKQLYDTIRYDMMWCDIGYDIFNCNWVATRWQQYSTHLHAHLQEDICINPLKAELNPICYLLALLVHHFLHVSRIRVNTTSGIIALC